MSPGGSFTDDQRQKLVESLRRNVERFRFWANLSLGASAVLTAIALFVFCAPESLFEDAISKYVLQQKEIEMDVTKRKKELEMDMTKRQKEMEMDMTRRSRLKTPSPPVATPKPEASP